MSESGKEHNQQGGKHESGSQGGSQQGGQHQSGGQSGKHGSESEHKGNR